MQSIEFSEVEKKNEKIWLKHFDFFVSVLFCFCSKDTLEYHNDLHVCFSTKIRKIGIPYTL